MNVIMTITRALECNLVLQKNDADFCKKHDFIRLWWFLFSIYKHISICRIKYLYIPMARSSWTSKYKFKTFESKVTFLFYHSCSFGPKLSGMMFFSSYLSFFVTFFLSTFFSSNLVSFLLHVNSMNFLKNLIFKFFCDFCRKFD